MFRVVASRALAGIRAGVSRGAYLTQVRTMKQESFEEIDARHLKCLQSSELDGWELRGLLNEIAGIEGVPDPEVVIAALKACRRLNDLAVAIRFLELIRYKADGTAKDIYPYILQEIRPTLDELGINTPDELGYDRPELALEKYP